MIIEVLQIVNSQGKRMEYWELTARATENSKASGLCNHLHNSYEEAWNCVEAWKAAKKLSGDSL